MRNIKGAVAYIQMGGGDGRGSNQMFFTIPGHFSPQTIWLMPWVQFSFFLQQFFFPQPLVLITFSPFFLYRSYSIFQFVVRLCVCNARGKSHFLGCYLRFPFPIRIQYIIYLVRRSVGHASKDKNTYDLSHIFLFFSEN